MQARKVLHGSKLHSLRSVQTLNKIKCAKFSPKQACSFATIQKPQQTKQQINQQNAKSTGPIVKQAPKQRVLIRGLSPEALVAAHCFRKFAPNDYYIEVTADHNDVSKGEAVLVGPKVCKILDELGLFKPLLGIGKVLNHLVLCSRAGRKRVDHDFSPNSQEYPYVAVNGRMLQSLLITELPCSLSLEAATVKQSANNKIQISQRTGAFVRREYDLLIGADGPQSAIRNELFPETKESVKLTGFDTLSVVIPTPSLLDYQDHAFEWWGAMATSMQQTHGIRFGVLPLAQNLLDVYVHFPNSMQSSAETTPLATVQLVKKLIDSVQPKEYGINYISTALGTMLEQKRGSDIPEAKHRAGVNIILDKCHKENMVLIGEASHAIDNCLWQNTTVAVEDAYSLVKNLAETPSSPTTAFEKFNAERLPIIKERNQESLAFSSTYTKNFVWKWIYGVSIPWNALKTRYRIGPVLRNA